MDNKWDMLEMDILQQIGATAADSGSIALCELLGRDIKLNLPTVTPVEVKDFLDQEDNLDNMVSVECDIMSGLEGKVMLTFKGESAVRFVRICYPQYDIECDGVFTELGVSALKEVGNVVVSAYVKALGSFLNSPVIPSPPKLLRGSLEDVIEQAKKSGGKIYILLIDTVFERKQEKIEGRMEFMLTGKDKNLIQNSCHGMLGD